MDQPFNAKSFILPHMYFTRFLELKISPPWVVLITALLMMAIGYMAVLPLGISLFGRWVIFATALLISGVLQIFNMILFRRANTTWLPHVPARTAALVTAGLYRVSRNPMYLLAALFLTAWGVLLGNGFSFLFIPLFIIYLTRFQIIPEEQTLERLFGDEYREYKKRVRRWL